MGLAHEVIGTGGVIDQQDARWRVRLQQHGNPMRRAHSSNMPGRSGLHEDRWEILKDGEFQFGVVRRNPVMRRRAPQSAHAASRAEVD